MDGRGVPLSIIVTGANRHDVTQLEAVLSAIMVKRHAPAQRRNKHLCADAAYTGAAALGIMRISANVTGDFGNVTGMEPVLGCAGEIVVMGVV